MPLRIGNRVRETSSTGGTGALTLAGAVSGFQNFASACFVGDTVPYVITQGASWEVGIGTYSASNTLTRTHILKSSNTNAVVNFAASPADVALVLPAEVIYGAENRNLLVNSSFRFWQRTDPATYTSLADKAMGPDGWFVLSENGSIQAKQDTASNTLYSCILNQNHGSNQRFGIGQVLWSAESSRTGQAENWWVQARVQLQGGDGVIRAALLASGGTVDSADRDFVNNWASTNYSAGNFFKSAWIVIGQIATASGSDHYISFPVSDVTATNNIGLFIWHESQRATSSKLEISEPILSDTPCPQVYKVPKYAGELGECLRRFCKTFPAATVPANNPSTGINGAIGAPGLNSGFDPDAHWRFPVEMGKTPTIKLYNYGSGTAGQWSRGANVLAGARSYGVGTSGCLIDNTDGAPATTGQYYIHATAEAEPCS